MRIGMKFKMLSIGGATILLFLLLLLLYVIPTLGDVVYKEKEIQTQELVRTTLGILKHYNELAKTNVLSENEAKEQAKNIIKAMTFGEGGRDYFWIQDASPRMIMHPLRADLDGKDIGGMKDPRGLPLFVEAARITTEEGGGYLPYIWQYYSDTTRQEEKISYVEVFKPWGWIVGTGVYLNDVEALVRRARNNLYITILVITLVSGVLAVFIANPIVSVMRSATGYIQEHLAEGDFRTEVPAVVGKTRDEFQDLAKGFGRMKASLSEMIGELQGMGDTMSTTSQNLSSVAEENAATIEEVASSVGTFSHTVNETKEKARTMENTARTIASLAHSGSTQMDATRSSMDGIIQSSVGVKTTLDELTQEARNMESILQLISDVADQTNLLALNAAIEAARAGEHGRGFSVVADEVRNLAEKTQQSVGSITQMIGGLVDKTHKAKSIMESADKQVQQGNSVLAKTQEDFRTIVERIEDTARDIGILSQAMQSLNETGETIAAAAQEQAASMEEVASSTENLAGVGDNLQGILSRFKV